MSVYYIIHHLSARSLLGHAKAEETDRYSFSLSESATRKCILQGTAPQEDNALFHQLLCALKLPTASTHTGVRTELTEAVFFMDFTGVFENRRSAKYLERERKAEAMFSPEGITLDFGSGPHRYLPFERSSSMSRESKLSFIRADLYELVRKRIMLDMKVGRCQLSKLYAYNGLMLSGGTRIDEIDIDREHRVIVVENPPVEGNARTITVEGESVHPGVKRYRYVEDPYMRRIPVKAFDGEGLISRAYAKQIDKVFCGRHPHHSFQVRLPFVKGMLHEVDYQDLLTNAGSTTITDIWGVDHPIEQVDIILTRSMFKGFDWLTENNMSWQDYWQGFTKYDHALYITGVSKEEPEDQTQLNYQFLTTLAMTAEEFRPTDLPLGWDHSPSEDPRNWITKTTEQRYYDLCCNETYRYKYFAGKKDARAKALRKNPLFIHETVFTRQLDDMAERTLKDYALGRLWVAGDVRYLSGDLVEFMASLTVDNPRRTSKEMRYFSSLAANDRLGSGSANDMYFFAPKARYRSSGICTILRNPHIARNEEIRLRAYDRKDNMRQWYLGHLSDVIMVDTEVLAAERLGGADYDGDMVKTIADPIVEQCVSRNYEYDIINWNNLPLLLIPSEAAVIRDADSWHDRFITVRDTFSARIGQICNAAFDRSVIAYDENSTAQEREQYRREVEMLAILSGLEIDSAKTGVKPDLDCFLKDRRLRRSGFLKYKELMEEDRSSWKKRKQQIESTDWSAVSSNVERLPYYAYMLERHTTKLRPVPARDEELFAFAVEENWRDTLDASVLASVSELLRDFEACLSRIRACKAPIQGRRREKDIARILFSRGQETLYDVDELYAAFSQLDDERVAEIRQNIRTQGWIFLTEEDRQEFLATYLSELSAFYPLLADFRAGGYRVLADLICDINDENRATERKKLHRETDSPAFSYMMDAYENKTPDLGSREAVSAACQELLRNMVGLRRAVRYIVALGKRELLWDLVPEQIEKEALKR